MYVRRVSELQSPSSATLPRSTDSPPSLRALGRPPSPAGAAPAARPFCILVSLSKQLMQAERDLPAEFHEPSLSQRELADQIS